MRGIILRLILRYGRRVTLNLPDGAVTLRAVLRPVTSKSVQSMRREMDELGTVPEGMYLLLAPPDCALAAAESVDCAGVSYLPRRVETITLGDGEYYIWGLLTRGGACDGEPAAADS